MTGDEAFQYTISMKRMQNESTMEFGWEKPTRFDMEKEEFIDYVRKSVRYEIRLQYKV